MAETTAQACIEVNDLSTEIYIKEELYWKLPDRLRDIIFYSLTLHDWPSKFCIATPSELLEDINELYNELPYRIMRIFKIHIENFRNIKNITLNYKKNRWFVEKENFDFSIILSTLDLALGERFYKITKDDFYKCNERNIIKINLYFNNFTPEDIEAIKKEITHHVRINGIFYTYIEIHKELELKREVRWEVKIFPNLAREQKLYIGELYYAYFSNKLKRILKAAIFDAHEHIVQYSKGIIVRKNYDVLAEK